ncbi:amidohydrolase [Alicyclobacillaceae bacterium I2511]|nr:amidohydrolase [Alicyclobacillaceae bacterium I2511]
MEADRWIAARRVLHQIPEAGFAEYETQAYLRQVIAAMDSTRLEVVPWRTGLLVKVHGTSPTHLLAYRADMDGLPITEQTSLALPSRHPGYMHACGHDLHMAIALGVLHHFVEQPMQEDLLVVFQPAEEGPGGAQPLLASEEFRRWRPDVALALHIAPEYPLGTVASRPGILFANTSELFIDLFGQGGHAAFPHRANDMVVAAAHLVTQLQSIVARNVNPLDAAVVTVGKITGGEKQNIIAQQARLEGTLRTLSQDTMTGLKARVTALVKGIETGFQCRGRIDWGANYCQVTNHPGLTQIFREWLSASGSANFVECPAAMTGEDFGYILEQIPGLMFWLGVQSPYSLHDAHLEPQEGAIAVGITVMSGFLRWLSEQSQWPLTSADV